MITEILETIKGKFIIAEDRIISIRAFSARELMFNEIKGYRIANEYILIESRRANKKTIKVRIYKEKMAEIYEWLAEDYRDLDID